MISHKHKCVFIHIPKCGGQTVEDAFIKENGLTWKSREPLVLRRNDNPLVGPRWLAHLTYSQYVKYAYLSQDMMDDYYTFSIVRSPFARIESAYRYLGFDCAISFSAFVSNYVSKQIRPESEQYYFFRPQSDFLSDESGALKVDDIFKLEHFKSAEPEIIRKAGLSVEYFLHVNKSPKRGVMRRWKKRGKYFLKGYRALFFDNEIVWSNDLIDKVETWYAKDFDALQYERKSTVEC